MIPDNSSITTSIAYIRIDLTDGTNVLDSAADYNIPVQTPASDTITSVTWPQSVPVAGPATATIQYSASPGDTLTVYTWDSNFNWVGQTSQTVSGNGTASVTVPFNLTITTGTAYMRADLLSGTTVLSEASNYAIPVQ